MNSNPIINNLIIENKNLSTDILRDVMEKVNKSFKNYQSYNGSYLYHGGLNYFVWRCQKKPELRCSNNVKTLPTYPYITMDGNWRQDEFLGIYIYKEENKEQWVFHPYRHENIYAAEDPRLYLKNGSKDEIYMSYTSGAPCASGMDNGDDNENIKRNSFLLQKEKNWTNCNGPYELNLTKWLIDRNNTFPILICKTIISQNPTEEKGVFDFYGNNIYKNLSYNKQKNTYMDMMNGTSNILEPTGLNKCKITKDTQNVLSTFVQVNWKIALTTPTIKDNDTNDSYGVIHIRVPWKEISKNYDSLQKNLKKIILKNDVHHQDFYFMSIYKMDISSNMTLSNPFLITGKTDENYYSYNINFPVNIGIIFKEYEKKKYTKEFVIQWGLGDCLFYNSNISFSSVEFKNQKFEYKDLEVYDSLKDQVLLKENVLKEIRPCFDSYKYFLPKHMFLFDLGGSGLKYAEYSFGRIHKQKNLGKINANESPQEFLRRVLPEIYDYMHYGIYLSFSLANIEKLWKNRVNADNYFSQNDRDIKSMFNIPKHIKLRQMGDVYSHLLGNLYTLKHGLKIKTQNVISIAIGTGINAYHLRNGIRQKFGEKNGYFWENKYNGKNIRDAILSCKTEGELLEIIYTLYHGNNQQFNNEYIILSGGGVNKLVNNIFEKRTDYLYKTRLLSGEVGEEKLLIKAPKYNMYFNIDVNVPYVGLVYFESMIKGIEPKIIV